MLCQLKVVINLLLKMVRMVDVISNMLSCRLLLLLVLKDLIRGHSWLVVRGSFDLGRYRQTVANFRLYRLLRELLNMGNIRGLLI